MTALKPTVFTLCLIPLGWLFYGASQGLLGPDPAEQIMHVTGEWSLRILILTLLVSPLRQFSGWGWPLRLRRMLGLFVFFYACVHLLTFAHFYIGWTPAILLEEVIERPYITVGALAWLLLIPLTATSTRRMQRLLRRNWRRLHLLVYPVALLACLHLTWQARSDIGEALIYTLIVVALLGWRLRGYIPARFGGAKPCSQ